MQINTNITAMNTLRLLNNASQAQSKSMAKLSSGLRINSAADDAAGLSISEKMKGQIRGLDQASRNAQDGISMTQTAEGALNETTDILQRMRELATQSANDTNTDQDRGAIQDEMNQLTDEINRIGNTTEFNTQKLLNGGNGTTAAANVTTVTPGVAGTPATGALGNFSVTTPSVAGSPGTPGVYSIELTNNVGAGETVSFGGVSLTEGTDFTAGADATATASAIATALTSEGTYSASAASGVLTLTETTASGNDLTASDFSVSGAAGTQGVYSFDLSQLSSGDKISIDDQEFTLTDDASQTGAGFVQIGADATETATNLSTAINGNDDLDTKYSAVGSGSTVQLTQTVENESATAPTVSTTTGIGSGFSATLQIGANTGQSMTINISDMRSAALGISSTTGDDETVKDSDGNAVTASFITTSKDVTDGTSNEGTEYALDLSTSDKASAAITVIDNAINTVSAERSKLGAYENRLDHTINNLNTSSQNITEASSRITDVDMASEMSEQTKDSILSQAAQAMLAQANQQPQQVLQLLRG